VTRLWAWIAFLVAALTGLHAAPIPATDAVTIGFAAVRVAGLVLGWYLLAVTLLCTATHVADAVTPAFVRALRDRALGIAMVAALATPPAVMAAAAPAAAVTAPVRSAADAPPVMHLVDDASAPAPAPAPTAEPAPVPSPDQHVVAPGESLWSIAEHITTLALGRPATDAEVGPRWRALVVANPLPDPDVVFTGQVVRVPPADSVQPNWRSTPILLPRTD
jgi:nucleoid-associated protein YgaU